MVICQKCWKEPATVHLTEVDAGVPERTHFCESCATGTIERLVPKVPPVSPEDQAAGERLIEIHTRATPVPRQNCQSCGREQAVIHITAREGARHVELDACRDCVEKQGRGVLTDIRRVEALRPRKRGLAYLLVLVVGLALSAAGYAVTHETLLYRPALLFSVPIAAFAVAEVLSLFSLGRSHARSRRSPASQGH